MLVGLLRRHPFLKLWGGSEEQELESLCSGCVSQVFGRYHQLPGSQRQEQQATRVSVAMRTSFELQSL
jgi:hypothetical protein